MVDLQRELMPSLAKTLRRWASIVRGDRNRCAAICLLENPGDDELGGPQLLRGQLIHSARPAPAGGLADGPQLETCPLGPRVGLELLETADRRAQMVARVHPSALLTQMLAEEEVDAGAVEGPINTVECERLRERPP
ncbi:MAG TPA: hypothetical protein VER39_12925 [Nocardioidaceae bacterium]|nr:hypothetical protein [Nocardioidaceae bacterium]